MDAPKENTQAKLLRQIAETEATLEALKEKLAKIEAKKAKVEAPASGLEILWKAAPVKARNRSTKHQCRTAFNRIPKGDRPALLVMLDAMTIWSQSEEWRKDGGMFIPALHRWITNRAWECPPEIRKAPSRARQAPVTTPVTPPGEGVTDKAEIAQLLSLKPTPESHEIPTHRVPDLP